MGNCLKKRALVEPWGGDEWKFFSSRPRKPAPLAPYSSSSSETDSGRRKDKCKKVRFNAHVEVFGGGGYEDPPEENVRKMEQVRIRISKKQLEEFLGKVELESMSVDEIMSWLIAEIHFGEPQEDDHGQKPCEF